MNFDKFVQLFFDNVKDLMRLSIKIVNKLNLYEIIWQKINNS